jgi:amino acid adenylation domain-containing protein
MRQDSASTGTQADTGNGTAGPGRPPIGPAWGIGDRRDRQQETFLVDLPADTGTDRDSWIAALAVTLYRYEGHDASRLIPVGTDRGAVEVAVKGTLGELRGRAHQPASRVPVARFAASAPAAGPDVALVFSVGTDASGTLRLRCDCQCGLVSPAVAAGFTRHLARVHRQILGAPAASSDDIVLLDDAELDAAIALGSPVSEPRGPYRCLPEAFRDVVAACPDAIALSDNETRVTYRDLDAWSDAMASGLRACGVRAGSRVLICLERTAELVATMLAVLKASAAYVPVDPAYPARRLAYTARDAGVAIAVTRLAAFPGDGNIRAVTPDALSGLAASAPPGTGRGSTADAPAYVIYTSGSSGRPKGVVVPHRNVVALVEATRDDFGLRPGETWSLFHSSAFDFSVWEIWGCLLTGGHLVVVPHDVSLDPERFRDLLTAAGVTVLSQTPSAFSQLLAVDHHEVAARLVVLGGEPLDPRVLVSWFDAHPETSCRVVNMYGITETTVHVTAQTVTRELALEASKSVGRPLPGWRVYVLDSTGRPTAPGALGEIYVAGAGVAHGYLGRADLTAQRFLPDRFRGGIMYRTGDLGRMRPDGRLEHLGRMDTQVKVRGFRIELDEIRSVLLEDPGVLAAVAVVRRNERADPASARIDAYVVLGERGELGRLRQRLRDSLPEHAVPATVTPLRAFPLTANGKLDVARLPAPAVTGVGPPAAPRGSDGLAEWLREIWTNVLGAPVALDDDFFELGGNSLLAIRIRDLARVHGLPDLLLTDIYRGRTVRALAAMSRGGESRAEGGDDQPRGRGVGDHRQSP